MRFFGVLVLLLIWPLAGVAQQDDRGYIQGLLEDALSDAGREVRISGFAGALSSRATIDQITVADDDGVWLTMTDVAMTWTRTALLRGAVDIDEISAARIEIPRLPVTVAQSAPPTPEARSPFKLPELPVSLRLADLTLSEVVLGDTVIGEAVVLQVTGNAELSGGDGTAEIAVRRLDAGGALRLAGAYSNTSRVLNLDSRFEEPAGGLVVRKLGLPGAPSVDLSLSGDAPIDDFVAKLRLATEGQERLAGQVVLRADGNAETQRLSVDIGGDLAPVLAPDYRAFLGRDMSLTAEALRRADGALELEGLDLRAKALHLQGSAAIAADGWPQRLNLSGKIVPPAGKEVLLPLPGQRILLGGAVLSGSFDADRSNAWQLALDAERLTSGPGTAQSLRLSAAGEIDRAASHVTGDVSLTAAGLAPADPALARALGQDLRGSLALDWRLGGPLTIRDMDLSGADYGVTGDVSIDSSEPLNPQVSPDLRLAAKDLGRFAGLAGVALSGAAELNISGAAAPLTGAFDLSFDGTTRDLGTGIAQVDPLIAGRAALGLQVVRDQSGLRAERLVLTAPQARIEGSGRFATGASTARLTARILDTSLILPDLSGPSRLTLGAEQAGDVWTLEAQGRLAQAGRLDYLGTVDLGGDVPFLAGRLDAALTRLDGFSELAGRALRGSGQITLTGEGRLDGASFRINSEGQLQDVGLSLPDIDPMLRGTTRLTLSAARSANGPITLDPLQLTGAVTLRYSGTVTPRGQRGADVDGTLTASTASLAPLSRLAGRDLRGSAQIEARASGGVTEGALSLTASLRGQGIGIGEAMLDPLLRGASRLDLSLSRVDGGALEIRQLSLGATGLDGTVSGTYGPGTTADLRLEASLPNLGVIVPELPGAARVSGTARQQQGSWRLSLDGTGPGGVGARIGGIAAGDFSTVNLTVNGSAPLALANGQIAPQVVTGVAQFDLQVNGAPSLAAVSGTVSTNGARFAAPAQGIVLNDLTGQARMSGGQAELNFGGTLNSGGQGVLTGQVTLSPPFNGGLVLELRQAVLRQAGLFETTANGRIRVDGPLTGGARIGGTVDLGLVEARIPSIAASYASLDGLQHVDTPRDVQLTLQFAGLDKAQQGGGAGGGTMRPYPLDLTVQATNRIFVRGRGLDAELGGALRLTGTTADVVPVGQFDLIRGRLDLLGRRLELTEGSVFLRGSFDPVIRFVATTQVESTDITITIEGPASSPDLTVGSSPELPQDEALSFFLFGKSVTNLSALQAVQLASAIRTLSGSGGLGLTETLRGGLGVSDLDIGTADDGTAQARVGGYLAENVYSDVTVNAKGDSEINLNLTVTPDVTVRGRLGSDGSSGLGVFFERDY